MNTQATLDWRDQIFDVLQTHDVRQVYHLPDAGHARLIEACQKSNFIRTVREPGDVAQFVKDVRTRKGPIFRVVKVKVEKLEFVMPPQDGAYLKDRFRQALLGPGS